MMNLNELRDKAYKIACDHGFHDQELSNEHCLMLVITELSETVEADRKGKYANIPEKKVGTKFDSRFFHEENIYFIENFEKFVKDTVEDEFSDTVIRLLDLAGYRGIQLDLAQQDIDNEDVIIPDEHNLLTESIYDIVAMPERYRGVYDIDELVNDMISSVFGLTKRLNFDLEWHVEKKMMYNSLRKKMHGKKY